MTTIQVLEAARCGGGCGCSNQASEATFAADFKWATQMGARIERATVDAEAFKALPVMLVDGEIAVAGRYPTRAEIAKAAGFEPVAAGDAGHCCSGGRCAG